MKNRLILCLFVFASALETQFLYARGGGGCFLPNTQVLLANGKTRCISQIKPGDSLLAYTGDEHLTTTKVRQIITHTVNDYYVVSTLNRKIQVTGEHPFYAGNGQFRTVETLNPGDHILVYDRGQIVPERITAICRVFKKGLVYNIEADEPHTYFADSAAVHNKGGGGGGGGCFAAGTMISTPTGEAAIELIKPGDLVTAVDENGRAVNVRVREQYRTFDQIRILKIKGRLLKTTAEHPISTGTGKWQNAGSLKPGDLVAVFESGEMVLAPIDSVEAGAFEDVYNLSVEQPHTYVAQSIIVHNKGGGGFGGRGFGGGGYHGGRYHGYSGTRHAGPISDSSVIFVLSFVGLFFGVVAYGWATGGKVSRTRENLDFLFGPEQINKKSCKTIKLLDFIARQDPAFKPEALRRVAQDTFLKLQQCWQARQYDTMQNLLMPDLYSNHLAQIKGLIRNHEINMISGIRIDRIDLVNVRYTFKEQQREFTALISARARDYYIDDRNNEFLRGDCKTEAFQEFWTFQYINKQWLLREIEQTRESDALKDENFFEQYTDHTLEQIYGEDPCKNGQAGPWLDKKSEKKDTRIERMLNFLYRTDKLWNRLKMLETTRSVFLKLITAWESGKPEDVPSADLFPDIANQLLEKIHANKAKGLSFEFRNLCVRKIELVLIRNFSRNSQDEFVARIRAHAQKIALRNGEVIEKDDDVTFFEQYVTMGRLDNSWKLKEILTPDCGEKMLSQENLDEESSPQMVQWYYQHKRAL